MEVSTGAPNTSFPSPLCPILSAPASLSNDNRKQREKKEASKKAKAEVPAITLEFVIRENPGISIPDAFQKLEVLRAQEEQNKAGGSTAAAAAALAAGAPTTATAAAGGEAAVPMAAAGFGAAAAAAAAAGAGAEVSERRLLLDSKLERVVC